MYPCSVSDCPSPECGVSCILIVDHISKSALVLFNLLRASKHNSGKASCSSPPYYYQKDTQMIISHFLWSQYHKGEWPILYFFLLFLWMNKTINRMYYCILNSDDNIIFVTFSIKMSCIIVFLTNSESVISWYFMSQLFWGSKRFT